MVNKYKVEGFNAFVEKVEALKSSGKPTVILFSGSADSSSGKSWCPDCVVASPVIDAALEKIASEDINFLYVGVGESAFWKDKQNPFRTDPRTKLKSVPTLLNFGTSNRLEEDQCAKANLVEMLFEDL